MRSIQKPDLLAAFAVELKAARSARKITQDQLAYSTGINRVSIARIEVGRFQPTISMLFDICRGLDMPAEELIGSTRLRLEKNQTIQRLISPAQVAVLAERRSESALA
jgi:DNA-binding XRE family transcriptional regulator